LPIVLLQTRGNFTIEAESEAWVYIDETENKQ